MGAPLYRMSVGNAASNNLTRNDAKAPEAQMDYDWSNDDLLGEENELTSRLDCKRNELDE
jgi:hypothetical protein